MKEITIQTPITCANVGPGYDIFAVSLAENSDIIKLKLNDSGIISIKVRNNFQNIPT
ncbi:MAG: homoserine kinase, partial [Candidatus Cloacimonadota bacterium]